VRRWWPRGPGPPAEHARGRARRAPAT
jgi:hypothetical protein